MSTTDNPNTQEQAGGGVWDQLTTIYQNCGAYTTIPAMLLPFIRNRELVDKIADQQALLDHAQILSRDVAEFGARLTAIHNKHAGKTGAASNPDEHMTGLQLCQEYVGWSSSYEAVVIPTVETILDMFAAIGVDVSSVRLPPPSQAVFANQE